MKCITLDLREGSEIYEILGPKVTVEFVYTQKERRMLEEDSTCLDGIPNIKAKGLVFLFGKGKDKKELLLKEGIPVKDIVSAFTIHYTPENNTFTNSDKRSLDVLEVPFEPYGNGDDIGWWYGFLCRQKKDGVGLMPEYEYEYLACKYIIEKNNLTAEERNIVYNEYGKVGNPDVAYHILFWRKSAGIISDKDSKFFDDLKQKRNLKRV